MSNEPRLNPFELPHLYIARGNTSEVIDESEVIAEISDGVDQRIASFPHEERFDGVKNELEMIILEAREMQLQTLAEYVFEIVNIVKNEDNDIGLDIDDVDFTQGIEVPDVDEIGLEEGAIEAAIENGRKMGTDDFLELLVPSDITDQVSRTIYFAAWERELLRKRHMFNDDEDGWAAVSLATRIPNVEINYFYPPHHRIPKRRITAFNDQ